MSRSLSVCFLLFLLVSGCKDNRITHADPNDPALAGHHQPNKTPVQMTLPDPNSKKGSLPN